MGLPPVQIPIVSTRLITWSQLHLAVDAVGREATKNWQMSQLFTATKEWAQLGNSTGCELAEVDRHKIYKSTIINVSVRITVPTGCSALGYSAFSTKACAFQRNVACAISTPRATCFLKKYGRWAGSLKWFRISASKELIVASSLILNSKFLIYDKRFVCSSIIIRKFNKGESATI